MHDGVGAHGVGGRVGTALLVALGILVVLPAGRAQAEQHLEVSYVTPETVKDWLGRELPVFFLDVREADEFAAGHLPGAVNVRSADVVGKMDDLPHDRPIILYCIHSAHRAPEAARTLRQKGFDNAHVLEGGIVAWQAGGMTIRASDLTRAPTILPLTERCTELGATRAEPEI